MQPIQINVSVNIGVTPELNGLLTSLFNRPQVEAPAAAPAYHLSSGEPLARAREKATSIHTKNSPAPNPSNPHRLHRMTPHEQLSKTTEDNCSS